MQPLGARRPSRTWPSLEWACCSSRSASSSALTISTRSCAYAHATAAGARSSRSYATPPQHHHGARPLRAGARPLQACTRAILSNMGPPRRPYSERARLGPKGNKGEMLFLIIEFETVAHFDDRPVRETRRAGHGDGTDRARRPRRRDPTATFSSIKETRGNRTGHSSILSKTLSPGGLPFPLPFRSEVGSRRSDPLPASAEPHPPPGRIRSLIRSFHN